MMLQASSSKIAVRGQASRARAVAVRAQVKDAPSAASRVMSVAAATVVAATTLISGAASAADLALGAQVFNGNCTVCHQGGGNSVKAGHTLQKEAIAEFLGGFTLENITTQIQNGGGGMPAWDGNLEDEEIEAVAAYVYDQAAGNKW